MKCIATAQLVWNKEGEINETQQVGATARSQTCGGLWPIDDEMMRKFSLISNYQHSPMKDDLLYSFITYNEAMKMILNNITVTGHYNLY